MNYNFKCANISAFQDDLFFVSCVEVEIATGEWIEAVEVVENQRTGDVLVRSLLYEPMEITGLHFPLSSRPTIAHLHEAVPNLELELDEVVNEVEDQYLEGREAGLLPWQLDPIGAADKIKNASAPNLCDSARIR